MLFPQTIEVKAEQYDPLIGIKDKDLPVQLELKADDLRELDAKIKAEYSGVMKQIQGKGVISDGTRSPINMLEESCSHGRAVFSRRLNNQQIVSGLGKDVVCAKGSGVSQWIDSSDCAEFKTNNSSIIYPIYNTQSNEYDKKFWGGMSVEDAKLEYVNSLILNALIRRHDLEEATYKPLKISKFKQLPLVDDKGLRIASKKEYISNPAEVDLKYCKANTLSDKEFQNIGEFFYVGDSLDLRVKGYCPLDKGINMNNTSVDGAYEKTMNATKRMSDLVKVLHSYGGTFTEIDSDNELGSSSLHPRNVTLTGVICDLDTLNFPKDKDSLERCQDNDKDYVMRTATSIGGLFDPSHKYCSMRDSGEFVRKYLGA